MTALIVDSRETNSMIPTMLKEAGLAFEQQEMDVGDYRIGPDIVIERKSARTDLAVSIMEGRLFGQAEALCAVAARPVFLVEGNLSDVKSQIGEDALWGAISALSVFWHMQVLFSQDVRSSAKLIGTMARHVTEGGATRCHCGVTSRRQRTTVGCRSTWWKGCLAWVRRQPESSSATSEAHGMCSLHP